MTVAQTRQNAGFDEEQVDVAKIGETTSTSKKAPGAFLTISEVAAELDVQQHVLRFWETKFTQVKPLKRGGGRRYYRPEDVALLKKIHTLLYSEGYTIKGVQKLLKTIGKARLLAEGKAAEPIRRNVVAANEAARNETASSVSATSSIRANNSEAGSLTDAMEGKQVAANKADGVATGHDDMAPLALTDKQRSILQAMLGDLRDLRDMIGSK